MARLIRISFDTVTAGSAENGEVADSGWVDEVEVDEEDVVACAVRIIGNSVEASDYPRCCPRHTWYTDVDADVDYSTGAETRQSYHLDGFSEDEELAIYAALVRR